MSSYRAFIVSSAIADTYGPATLKETRTLVEKRLRIADVLFWLQRSFGDGALALLILSDWKKM